MVWNAANDPQEHITPEEEAGHSDAPWAFVRAPKRAPDDDAINGWIMPHGAREDDPAVAWIENVGSVDLAIMLAAPDMLAALNGAKYTLEIAQDREGWCDCTDCPECGKPPMECTGTPCAQTCQCTVCGYCECGDALQSIEAAIGKAKGA